ncbi:hypothetical protein vBSflM004_089 [Shigella phage vB_SflM_004]|nr:hypothetical protein vBSflM004_089 [Shigella phage vB_SflM_004]
MAMYQQYSPKDVVCSWNGIAIEGFAPDSFLRLQRTSPLVTPVVGAGGQVALTRNADKTGTIEIELMQTSLSNQMLSAIQAKQDDMELEEDISSNFVIYDPSGSVLVIMLGCKSFHRLNLDVTRTLKLGFLVVRS